MLPNLNACRQFFTIMIVVFLVQPLLFSSPPENSSQEVRPPLGEEYQKWHIYTIGEGWRNSLDVDSKCLPHISFHTYSDRLFRYATWKNGNWSIEVVDNRSGAAHTTSLVLDSEDRPLIAYRNSYPHPEPFHLGLASWNGNNWTFEKVVELGDYDFSLKLNQSENPKMSYTRGDWEVWFAERSPNGTWNRVLIDTDGDLRESSLAIDFRDHYHISYEEAGKELRYAYWNGTSWTKEKVDTNHWVGGFSSIQTDMDGDPHISYYDYPNKKLKYATKESGKWNITSIDYASQWPWTTLDLDSQERPHISYQGIDLHLRHAWWNHTSWETEIVDNSTNVGLFPTLRIDKNDDVHISYMDVENLLTKYASTKELPSEGVVATIDIDPDTLNLKSKGKFITAYIELEGADVKYIDASSIMLNVAISPILDEKYGFVTSEDSYIVDHDNDGIMERMVKFNRAEVQRLLTPADEVLLTITGYLNDGTGFEGSDTIRVINPP